MTLDECVFYYFLYMFNVVALILLHYVHCFIYCHVKKENMNFHGVLSKKNIQMM